MNIVQKLTAKTLGWDRNHIGIATTDSKEAEGRVELGRIAGIVSGLRITADDNGEVQTGLKGNFRGISTRADVGDVTSGVCYLPSGIQSMIEAAFVSAQEADKKATVTFAVDLIALRATNKAGYTFEARNIIDAAPADPLTALLERAVTIHALPAPTDEDKGEAAPDTAEATPKAKLK